MTPEELSAYLTASTEEDVLRRFFDMSETPYVFASSTTAWSDFREELSAAISANPDDIRVVGSGRFGFSLKPGNNLRRFQDKSDVDVAVVNPQLFDTLWLNLLDAEYPRPPAQNVGAALSRQKSVYTGWIQPEDVRFDVRISTRARLALQFKAQWFDALKKSSKHIAHRHENVAARLYRTWDHASRYHAYSLTSLKNSLTAQAQP